MRWSEFEQEAPHLAATGAHLLTQYGLGLGFLATVGAEGAPRIHPICPVLADGGLWAFVIASSPKCADLRRNGQFALHACQPEEVDDEFTVRGRAVAVDETVDQRARLRAATTAQVGRDDEVLFELHVDRAMSATYVARGVFPPTYEHWRAGRAPTVTPPPSSS